MGFLKSSGQDWDGKVFAAPYTDGVVAASDDISNSSNKNSIKVEIDFESLTPNGAPDPGDWALQVHVQEKIAANKWQTIAASEKIFDQYQATLQRIEYRPGFVDSGQNPDRVDIGGIIHGQLRLAVNRFDASIKEVSTLRVCVVVSDKTDGIPHDLTSVTLTGTAIVFDR